MKKFKEKALNALQQLGISAYILPTVRPGAGKRVYNEGGDTRAVSPKVICLEWNGILKNVSVGWLRNFLRARGYDIPSQKERKS